MKKKHLSVVFEGLNSLLLCEDENNNETSSDRKSFARKSIPATETFLCNSKIKLSWNFVHLRVLNLYKRSNLGGDLETNMQQKTLVRLSASL